jgi:hypothetical protein
LGTAIAGHELPNLSGRRFLVIEDEPLIGLDIVAALEEAQAQVEGPVSTAEKAFAIMERTSLDGALLMRICTGVNRRGVPTPIGSPSY